MPSTVARHELSCKPAARTLADVLIISEQESDMARRAPSPRKVQSNLYINRTDRDRVDAVALVIPDSRAEVLRRAISIGLVRLENDYRGQMTSLLSPVAERFGMDVPTLAGQLAERDLTLADVLDLPSFPE
jgi:dihydropteroate synthase